MSVCLLSATNVDLRARIQENQFREDLDFRIASYEFQVKPSRERHENTDVLAEHFLRRSAAETNTTIPELSDEARQALFDYHFPGNVRELKSVMERAVEDEPP